MAIVRKQDLMLYCKVDEGDPREELLPSLAEAAETKLLEAGVQRTANNAALFDLAIKAITLHWLDNPTGTPIPGGLQTMINELKRRKGG